MGARDHAEFYAALLAKGFVPGEQDVPRPLLEAMATLIGRSIGAYVDPKECAGPAALVVLALLDMGYDEYSQAQDQLRNEETSSALVCIQNTKSEIAVN